MIAEDAKKQLHDQLRLARKALVWKLDGLSEYDVRRPMTATGTNLLGLIKHTATWEARYFGEVFERPFPEMTQRRQDSDGSDLWVTAHESRERILDFARRVWSHADATIEELSLEAPGQVPWWPRPDVHLFSVMLHVLGDTIRHAGHADIVREQLDGQTGVAAGRSVPIDSRAREAHCSKVEAAARASTADGRA